MRTYRIIKYKCRIDHLGLTNVIETIFWEITEPTNIDGTTYNVTIQGGTSLPEADPNNFIVTGDLTKEQVVTWIETYSEISDLLLHQVNIVRNSLNPTHTSIIPNFS
jgi:hypothetical protein